MKPPRPAAAIASTRLLRSWFAIVIALYPALVVTTAGVAAITGIASGSLLADAFRETLIHEGNYVYVAEIPVLQRIKDRTLYSLFYGTRHEAGMEVFRGCHVKTERQQGLVRAATKRAHHEEKTKQPGLFDAGVQLAPDDIADFLESEKKAAESTLLALVPVHPDSTIYVKVWPRVLEKHVVTLVDVNRIAARLRKEGTLVFPDWELGRRVPQEQYSISKFRQ